MRRFLDTEDFSTGISYILDLIRNLVLIIHMMCYTDLDILSSFVTREYCVHKRGVSEVPSNAGLDRTVSIQKTSISTIARRNKQAAPKIPTTPQTTHAPPSLDPLISLPITYLINAPDRGLGTAVRDSGLKSGDRSGEFALASVEPRKYRRVVLA